MTKLEQEPERTSEQGGLKQEPSLMVTSPDNEFEREVLERLGRLQAKIDMLVGNGQPGRMKLAEDRLATLEKNDIRRSVHDRIVNAVIATAISVAVALHDHLGLK